VGSLISQYLIMRGYDVCIIDNRPPAFYGHTRARFYCVDLLKDPLDSIIPHYLHGKHIVVLNAAMVRTPENGGPPTEAEWNCRSHDLNPLLADTVIKACIYRRAHVKALYYISTLSVYDIEYYRQNGILIPENVDLGRCASSGYGIGKLQAERMHIVAESSGLCSTGIIRLSTPKDRYDADTNWFKTGKAYILTKEDCSRGVERVLTQNMHPKGCVVYQLDSLNPSIVQMDSVRALGYVPQYLLGVTCNRLPPYFHTGAHFIIE